MAAFVSLIGAGPGDPELITVRGQRALAAADVIVHDDLVDRRLLIGCAGRPVYGLGDRRAPTAERQRHLYRVLAEQARAGRRVAHLKGGDPLLYGRGAEEIQFLRAAGIPYEVVPGITAAVGAAAYAELPLTRAAARPRWRCVPGIPSRSPSRRRIPWSTTWPPPGKSLTGTIPAGLGRLFALTTLNLSTNSLTGAIPAELGWLTNLTELRLSGNSLTGCIPLSLRSVATNDLSALNLLYCEPPAPTNLSAGTPGEASVALTWNAVPDAGTYRVEYRAGDPAAWTTDSDEITGATHTVDELQCDSAYEFRVSAYGSGTTYAAAWSEPSATVAATTEACTPPTFGAESYSFTVDESAAVGTVVGTVTAADDGGGAVTYAITEGDNAGAFAIDAASGAITVAGALDGPTTPSYTLTATATDSAENAATVTIVVTVLFRDYDADDDGLIDVGSLAQLDAIRWDLDGDGSSTDAGYAAAFPNAVAGMGCPSSGCTGYELTADLDFDTNGSGGANAGDAYWDNGRGWRPLGASGSEFTATFEGNGHTIAHLFISRSGTGRVGLFRQAGAASVIRNVGLRAVGVRGELDVGGLVGWNAGAIRASYVTGQVRGDSYVGGLVGTHTGSISASYAAGTVRGNSYVGGLAGVSSGSVTAAYARGAVTHSRNAGGLAGQSTGPVAASYATARVTGRTPIGGLIGVDARSVTASYWDTETSGQAGSAGGAGKTTNELQTPTGYTGIYAAWNVNIDGVAGNDDPWDFGTASQYPALKVDFNGDGVATWHEFGDQRPGATNVPTTPPATPQNLAATPAAASVALEWDATPNVSLYRIEYRTSGATAWTTDADAITDTTHTVDDLDCATAYEFRVSAYGDGVVHATVWSAASAALAATTSTCPPTFGSATYSFSIAEDAATDAAVGTVAATDADEGDTVTYSITAGNGDGHFAIDGSSGAISVAGTLDYETTTAYSLTVQASDGAGGTSTATVAISVTNVADAAPPAPTGLSASLSDDDFSLTWTAVTGAAKYDPQHHFVGSTADWASLAEVTTTSATYSPEGGPFCGTTYEFRVRAYGDGTASTAAWGAMSDIATVTTDACAAPMFRVASYTFAVAETAAAATVVGTVTSAASAGGAVTYSITEGNGDGHFAIAGSTGAISVAGALDYETTASYSLTVQASDAASGTATVTVTIDVTDVVDTAPPAPAGLSASLSDDEFSLTWTAVTGAAKYDPQVRAGSAAWASLAEVTSPSATYSPAGGPACGTTYEFQVRAYGDGTTATAAWGAPSTAASVATAACNQAPAFGSTAYSFSVAEDAATDAAVGTVTATDADAGDTLTYSITAGNGDGHFAIAGSTGAISVAGTLDYETTTAYSLTVQASDGAGGTATATVAISVTDILDTAPSAPQNFRVSTAAKTSLTLAWDALTGAASYEHESKLASAEEWDDIEDSVDTTSRTIDDLDCETAYDFRMRAYGDGTTFSEAWGAWAELLNVRTGLCSVPDAPGDFSATLSSGAFSFSWSAASGAAEYQVRYRIDEDADWVAITTTTATTASFSPTDGVLCDATYRFQVRAYGDGTTKIADWSSPSEDSETTPDCLALGTPVPSGAIQPTRMTLRWTRIEGAAKYQLRYREAGGEWPSTVTDISAAGSGDRRSFRVDGLTRGKTYEFQLRAYGNGTTHSAGEGAWSAELTAATTEPAAPTGLTVSASTANSLSLSWDAIPGAGSYQVQYRQAGNPTWTVEPETTDAAYTLTELEPDTSYVFKVRAKGDGARYIDVRPGAWSESSRGMTKE